MPHLILEASANIIASNAKIKQTLNDCQNLLVAKLPTQLSNCKSRLILHDLFIVGDGNEQNAFIHLTVKIMKGRSQELLSEIAQKLKQILINDFSKSSDHLNLASSVEIIEMNATYVN